MRTQRRLVISGLPVRRFRRFAFDGQNRIQIRCAHRAYANCAHGWEPSTGDFGLAKISASERRR